jgi:hypothetical protein
MKIERFNENLNENSIQKIETSFEDMNDFEGWQRCANIVYDHKQSNIEYDDMFNVFGEPCFADEDYDDDEYWILKYKNDLFSVSISPHGEGSMIDIYLPDQKNMSFSNSIKQRVNEFFDELYEQIGK